MGDLRQKRIVSAKLKSAALSCLWEMMLNLKNIRIKIDAQNGKPFASTKELPKVSKASAKEIEMQIKMLLQDIFPNKRSEADNLLRQCSQWLKETSAEVLFVQLQDLTDQLGAVVKEWGAYDTDYSGTVPYKSGTRPSFFKLGEINDRHLILVWGEELGSSYVTAVSKALELLRDGGEQPTVEEFLSTHIAYQELQEGAVLDQSNARGLGTPGFRPHAQTYMALTDPGDGHIMGTTRRSSWLLGAIIHMEHLERPGGLDRTHYESYRNPPIQDFAKVRLHVGNSAPNSIYVGRRLKDSGNFDEDYLKVVNVTSSACTAAFLHGAAECKVSMEGLTTSEAVRYMRGLAGLTLRKPGKVFSSAWNINQEVLDDFEQGPPVLLNDRMSIARRALQIVAQGGFDKITWDGASDTYPSECIMYQITPAEAIELVHKAHEEGLLTYVSAGFKLKEIPLSVYSGVDGVGIGGAQVLRFMDHQTGMHGPFTEENIPDVLATRDKAQASALGRGAKLLARLDTMYKEGSINNHFNTFREELYQVLLTQEQQDVEMILERGKEVEEMPDEGRMPVFYQAARLLKMEEPFIKMASLGSEEWTRFIIQLKNIVENGTEEFAVEEYGAEPWLSYRDGYRIWLNRKYGTKTQKQASVLWPFKMISYDQTEL